MGLLWISLHQVVVNELVRLRADSEITPERTVQGEGQAHLKTIHWVSLLTGVPAVGANQRSGHERTIIRQQE